MANAAERHLGRALAVEPALADTFPRARVPALRPPRLGRRRVRLRSRARPRGRAARPRPGVPPRLRGEFESGRYDEAAAGLTAAAALPGTESPRDLALVALRADVHTRAGRADLAAADLRELGEGTDHPADLLRYHARVMLAAPFDRRADAAALALARRAAALAPFDPRSATTLGVALHRAGEFAEARAVAVACLAGDPGQTEPIALLVLALCRERLGDLPAAREAYDRASAWRTRSAAWYDQDRDEFARLETEVRFRLLLALPAAAPSRR